MVYCCCYVRLNDTLPTYNDTLIYPIVKRLKTGISVNKPTLLTEWLLQREEPGHRHFRYICISQGGHNTDIIPHASLVLNAERQNRIMCFDYIFMNVSFGKRPFNARPN